MSLKQCQSCQKQKRANNCIECAIQWKEAYFILENKLAEINKLCDSYHLSTIDKIKA